MHIPYCTCAELKIGYLEVHRQVEEVVEVLELNVDPFLQQSAVVLVRDVLYHQSRSRIPSDLPLIKLPDWARFWNPAVPLRILVPPGSRSVSGRFRIRCCSIGWTGSYEQLRLSFCPHSCRNCCCYPSFKEIKNMFAFDVAGKFRKTFSSKHYYIIINWKFYLI